MALGKLRRAPNGLATASLDPENKGKSVENNSADTSELPPDLPEISRNSLDSRLDKSKKPSIPEKSRMSTDRVDRFRRRKGLIWWSFEIHKNSCCWLHLRRYIAATHYFNGWFLSLSMYHVGHAYSRSKLSKWYIIWPEKKIKTPSVCFRVKYQASSDGVQFAVSALSHLNMYILIVIGCYPPCLRSKMRTETKTKNCILFWIFIYMNSTLFFCKVFMSTKTKVHKWILSNRLLICDVCW